MCAKPPPRNRNFKMIPWGSQNQARLTDSILGLYSDNKEEYKIHFLFWQHCPKNNYSKWVPLKSTSHFTKWNKVILFNFRNVSAQPNDKCHLDPWCIKSNNFLDTNFRVGLPSLHASFHGFPAQTVSYQGKWLLNEKGYVILKGCALGNGLPLPSIQGSG